MSSEDFKHYIGLAAEGPLDRNDGCDGYRWNRWRREIDAQYLDRDSVGRGRCRCRRGKTR